MIIIGKTLDGDHIAHLTDAEVQKINSCGPDLDAFKEEVNQLIDAMLDTVPGKPKKRKPRLDGKTYITPPPAKTKHTRKKWGISQKIRDILANGPLNYKQVYEKLKEQKAGITPDEVSRRLSSIRDILPCGKVDGRMQYRNAGYKPEGGTRRHTMPDERPTRSESDTMAADPELLTKVAQEKRLKLLRKYATQLDS